MTAVVRGRSAPAVGGRRLAVAIAILVLVVTAVPVAAATPDAVDDSYTTPQGQELVVEAPGVLANDTADDATLAVETPPTDGDLALDADGGFTYTPDPGFAGTDDFVYSLTEPTTTGTVALGDVDAGTDDGLVSPQPHWADAAQTGDRIVFVADDGVHGREPWVADGSAGSAALLLDINPEGDAFASTSPPSFTAFDGLVWFIADDGKGEEVWRTDGTTAGTQVAFDLTGPTPGSTGGFTVSGGQMFFNAEGSLWVLDAATSTPTLLAENGGQLKASYRDGVLVYTQVDAAIGNELYFTDGGPLQLVVDLMEGSDSSAVGLVSTFGSDVYFVARGDPTSFDSYLWYWDGVGEVQLVAERAPANITADPGGGYVVTSGTVKNLYRYEPTGEVTTLVGSDASAYGPVAALDSRVVFTAEDDDGRELWTTDGTAAGTGLLADLNPGTADSYLGSGFSQIGNEIYVGLDDGVHGLEVWATDGTAANTRRLTDVDTAGGSSPVGYTAYGDGVFFFADDGATGHEPYVWATTPGGSDQATVTITVEADQQPPVLDPIGDLAATVSQPLSFTATASDPDTPDEDLVLSLAGTVPDGASITADGAFSWTPSASQVGDHTFDVVVSDGTLEDAETITVSVTEAVLIALTEGIGVADDVTVTRAIQLLVTEGIGVADAPDLSPAVQIRISEAVGVGEAVTANPPAHISIAESIGVADETDLTTVSEGVLLDGDEAVQQALMGQTYTFTGQGFAPGAEVLLELLSDPVRLGSVVADDDGAFSTQVTIPVTTPGEHLLVATGTGPTGIPHEVRAPVTVLAPATITLQEVPDRIRVRGPGGTAPSITISATLEAGVAGLDLAAGDPTIELAPIGPGSTVQGDCNLADDVLTCRFSDVPVNAWNVEASIGFPFTGSDRAITLVDDPGRGSTFGAARFTWPGTALDMGRRSDQVMLSQSLRYDPFGTAHGHVRFARRTQGVSVSSTRLHGAALSPATSAVDWAILVGDGLLNPPDDRHTTPVRFVVYVEEGGRNDDDRVWIDVRTDGDDVTGLRMPPSARTNAVVVDRGNLRISRPWTLPWR